MTEPVGITKEEFEERRAAQRAAEEKAQREAHEASEKQIARQDWIAAGGNPDDFESQWPEIRSMMLQNEVVGRRQQAREESRARTRRSF